MDKTKLEELLVSLVRVGRQQKSVLPSKPLKEELAKDWDTTKECHATAQRLASLCQEKANLSMEKFEDVISTSPRPDVTRRFLADAGPDRPELIGPEGPLPRIAAKIPETLAAGKPVNLTVKVWHVREREDLARVQIVHFHDEYSQKVLGQQSGEINLRFDHASTQREDLIAAQYLRAKLRIRATADCATDRRHSRKAALTLCEVSEPRSAMDKLHGMALQVQTQFDFGGDGPDAPETADAEEADFTQ